MKGAAKSNTKVAVLAAGVAFGMLGLAYASVPLYRLFCQVTGFGGTTQRAEQAPHEVGEKVISIRFDANTSGGLGWNFHPVQSTLKVKIGEEKLAFYRAVNASGRTITGSSVFNVTPESAGAYFNKIQCFCFTEQTLKPGESVDFPVVFFVDPAIADDPDTRSISEITLSYTFYPVEKPKTLSQATAAPSGTTN